VIVVRKEQKQFSGPESPSSNTEYPGSYFFHSLCNTSASGEELTAYFCEECMNCDRNITRYENFMEGTTGAKLSLET